MENQKHNFKQFNWPNGNFLLIDPYSISCIEQFNQNAVKLVFKSIVDGENITYSLNVTSKRFTT